MELHSSDVTRYGPIRLECGTLAFIADTVSQCVNARKLLE
jgi:hypothetical protein